METRSIRNLFALAGLTIGFILAYYGLVPIMAVFPDAAVPLAALIVTPLIVGLIMHLTAPAVVSWISRSTRWIEERLSTTPVQDIIVGATGLILGLIIANLIRGSLASIPVAGSVLPVAAAVLLGYLGWSVAVKKREDLFGLFSGSRLGHKYAESPAARGGPPSARKPVPKFLDTSVIIDGRIADISAAGFLEGPLIIPDFILDELRHIADSTDALRRNKGRRGLDVLRRIQQDMEPAIEIYAGPPAPDQDVDNRLMEAARERGGKILTTDYNLNKVAQLQGVQVLNINELANALKPVMLPGEELSVQVIREGKEPGQGVGYLDDGTMIVIEGARRRVGDEIAITVTSVIQTAAGRMIFARPTDARKAQ